MSQSRIPSPARSQGSMTPRRLKPRETRRVSSPARSTASGRLSAVVRFKENNQDSFALSPFSNRRSMLNDDTYIDQPGRQSWWKKLGEQSTDMMEVLNDDKIPVANEILEEYVDNEVPSQKKKDYNIHLSDSSGSELMSSIVISKRKLFTQKDLQEKNKVGKLLGAQEALPKPRKSTVADKSVFIVQKKLLNQNNRARMKPANSAALSDKSLNKTVYKTKQIDAAEAKSQVQIFSGNPGGTNRKKRFAEFIASESEDEIQDPEIFNRNSVSNNRDSSISCRKQAHSPTSSNTTDIEMDEWQQLPSSTMFGNQLEYMMAAQTPVKRARLSNLAGIKEVDNRSEAKKENQSEEEQLKYDDDDARSEQNSKKNNEEVDNQNNVNENKQVESTNEDRNNIDGNNISKRLQSEELPEECQNEDMMELQENVKESQVLNEDGQVENKDHSDDKNKDVVIENQNNMKEKCEGHVDTKVHTDHIVVHSDNEMQSDKTNSENDRIDADKSSTNNSHLTADQGHEDILDENMMQVEENEKLLVQNENDELVKSKHHDSEKNNDVLTEDKHITKAEDRSINKSLVQSEDDEKGEENEEEEEDNNEEDEVVEDVQEENDDQPETEVEDQTASEEEAVSENEVEAENESDVEAENESEVEAENESEVEAENESEIETQEEIEKSQIQDEDEELIENEEDEQIDNEEEIENVEENEEEEHVEENEEEEHIEENEEEEHEKENEEEENKEENEEEHVDVDENITRIESDAEAAYESEMEEEDDNEVEAHDEDADQSDSETGHEESSARESEIEAEDTSNAQGSEQAENQSEELQYESNKTHRESEDEQDGHSQSQVESEDEIQDSNDQEAQLSNNRIETSNVSHDTTGRNRRKNKTDVNSPEAILHDKNKQFDSFMPLARRTTIGKTIINNLNFKPSLAPPRESLGMSDGTTNSSAEGSGWDSHRTTRKTIRQTLGRDNTRKSLRALVMEKSAKRQTAINDFASVTTEFPQANSTELSDAGRLPDEEEIAEENHDVSKRTRQTTLEMYLQKIKKENFEKKLKMEEAVRNSLKAPPRDPFKVPAKPMFPVRKTTMKPAQKKPKKQVKSLIPLDDLPDEVIEDMKYKPPKRFQPSNAAWITKRLYKFLETKLEPKYDYKARVRAEKLVETIYYFAKDLRRLDSAPSDAVNGLKHEMARLDVVKTHFDFYQFFHDYMPREIRIKVVPDVVNKIGVPRNEVFSDILREKIVQGE